MKPDFVAQEGKQPLGGRAKARAPGVVYAYSL